MCAVALLILNAAPPATLTPEQMKLLDSRPWFGVTEKTLEIELSVYGPWHRQVEDSAESLAGSNWFLDDWGGVAKCRRAIVASRERLDGPTHWRTLAARAELAEALAQQKRTPAERTALSKAAALDFKAILERETAHVDERIAATEAVKIRGILQGKKHPDYAVSLSHLADAHALLEFEKAERLYHEAMKILRDSLGIHNPAYKGVRTRYVVWLLMHRQPDRAIALATQALKEVEELVEPGRGELVLALDNLAHCHHWKSNHREVIRLRKRVLAAHEAGGDDKRQEQADTLFSLGESYAAIRDSNAALSLFQRASRIYKETAGQTSFQYASCIQFLALLREKFGRTDEALRLYREALGIYQALGEEHDQDRATTLMLLGRNANRVGDADTASKYLKAALRLQLGLLDRSAEREELGAWRHNVDLMRVMEMKHPGGMALLLSLHLGVGDHETALFLGRRSLVSAESTFGTEAPQLVTPLNDLALVQLIRRNHKAAFPLLEKAITITFNQLRDAASGQSDREQLAAAKEARDGLDLRLSLADPPGHPSSAVHALSWKGAVHLRQARRRLFTALATDGATRGAVARLQAAARQLAALQNHPAATASQRAKAGEALEEAQAELSRRSAAFKEAKEKGPASPEAIAKALPPDAALIDYLFYDRSTFRLGGWNAERHLVAFVHRRGKPAERVDLGPASPVESAIDEWLGQLRRGSAGLAAGMKVKRLVWSPVEARVKGAAVVLISPDGHLAMAPFAALPGAKEGTYLIEDLALATVAVPQAIPEMLAPAAKAGRLPPSLLVVGDVDYDRAGAKPAKATTDERTAPLGLRRDWSELPATFTEAASVAKSFAGLFKDGTLTDLAKGHATKKAVREALGKSRYAHLATHGYFAPGVGGWAIRRGGEAGSGWHPLLLSGLALSGANREPKDGEEDGIFTALEVSEMEIPKLELVVLSACETGLGEVAGGEGLLGMQRAFQVAGARTVIASLWKVDDRATQALMADFYKEAWAPDKIISRAEALRQAQLKMLREGAKRGVVRELDAGKGTRRLPPRYWAAFVLSGDWR